VKTGLISVFRCGCSALEDHKIASFAKAGAQLTLVARRQELLENLKLELEKAHSTKVCLVQMDLSVPTNAEPTLGAAERALGRADATRGDLAAAAARLRRSAKIAEAADHFFGLPSLLLAHQHHDGVQSVEQEVRLELPLERA